MSIVDFDSIAKSAVYVGGFTELVDVTEKLNWDKEFCGELGMNVGEITLKEIANQLAKANNESIITVIVNHPRDTEVYQYGNYGDKCWYHMGTLAGYC